MPRFAPLIVLFFLSLSPASAKDAGAVLSAFKEATGGNAWDAILSLQARYASQGSGLSGTVEVLTDAVHGYYVVRYEAGALKGAEGYDGSRVWTADSSGQVRLREAAEARALAVNESYRNALAYWYPGRVKAKIAYAGERSEGGSVFDVLTVEPAGGTSFEMWFDTSTHLLARTVEPQSRDTITVFFGDFRAVSGVMLPHTLVQSNGVAAYDQTLSLQSVEFNVAPAGGAFAPPPPPAPDYTIANGKTETTIPFVLVNDHIYLDVMLDGKGPYRLLADTGGVNIVTPKIATGLGLKSEGALQGRGAGEGSIDIALAKMDALGIGEAEIKDQVFAVAPLDDFSDIEGVPFLGIVGYEVFKRFVVKIDYENSRLTLYQPEAFAYAGKGAPIPVVFDDHTPLVEAELDGLKGTFQLDTGARGSLTIMTKFADAHGLRTRYQPSVEAISGWGVGGPSKGNIVRAGAFKLGPFAIEGLVATLSLQQKGSFASDTLAGNIGGGVLKRFTLYLDYGQSRVILEPNKNFAVRDAYDRAGLWINRKGGGFAIVGVTPGSPAAEAGLKEGDLVLAIDGEAASKLSLPEVKARLRTGAPGTKLVFTVERAGARSEIALTLRDLI